MNINIKWEMMLELARNYQPPNYEVEFKSWNMVIEGVISQEYGKI